MRSVVEGARRLGAVTLGTVTAAVELVFLLVTLPLLGGTRMVAAGRLAGF